MKEKGAQRKLLPDTKANQARVELNKTVRKVRIIKERLEGK